MGILLYSVFLATLATQEPNEAEKLFRAMEQKIVAAKTMNLSCTTEGFVASGKMSGKVTWTTAQGNKANIELERTAGGKKATRHVVSNGDAVVQKNAEGKYRETAALPKELIPTARALLIDVGSYNPLFMWPSKLEGKSGFTRHDFKLGPEVKIGKRNTRVLEYTLKDANGTMKCKIWLDTETKLPLKRRIVTDDGVGFFVEENYTEFSIDGKVDAERFKLPK